ncbi:MAG TPA: S8 family serine peptidase, partial [Candidatus Krumholzibacteria bacterium]|nr:S8 family serine peptidase [Candidatus Krumholzibacteria bacterium]
MRPSIRNGFRRLAAVPAALAVVAVAGFGTGASAQRSTDVATLKELSQKFERSLQAKQTPLYFNLLASTDPAQQALNVNPEIKLMYIRENGVPAYYTVHNLNAALTTRTYDVWPVGVGNGFYNLTGSTTAAGELAVWDGGAVRAAHQEFGGRVTVMDGGSLLAHSTHVAGTMVGAGINVSARGGSYAAALHSYEWTNDTIEMAAAAAAGLQVSNHSYGFITGWFLNGATWYWYGDLAVSASEDYGFGYYDGSALEYDEIAYDAPYYLICVAAGNERDDNGPGAANHQHWDNGLGQWVAAVDFHPADGQAGGYDTISYFSTAKNILCVGACNDFPSGYTQPSDITLTAFTSWGPTDDGRIKPDIVANGAGLFSCTSTANNAYTTMSGTSMATPNAAGSVNLIAQDYEVVKGASPWSSTLKALVINAADETGPADGPDYMNGWGLLNTHRMADIVHAAPGADLGVLEAGLTDGETDTYYFEITSPQDARVTIVWTDPEGSPSPIALDNPTPKLINDLDLRVVHVPTATTTLPWRLDRLAPANAATKADNVVDNVEQVDIDTAPAGLYRVTVTHKGSLDPAGAQNYSLVYRGMHEVQSTPVGG